VHSILDSWPWLKDAKPNPEVTGKTKTGNNRESYLITAALPGRLLKLLYFLCHLLYLLASKHPDNARRVIPR
jgi:hypothetical protein